MTIGAFVDLIREELAGAERELSFRGTNGLDGARARLRRIEKHVDAIHSHEVSTRVETDLGLILELLKEIKPMRAEIAALTAVIQPLLDAVKKVDDEVGALAAQVATLQAGQALGPDDVAALTDAVSKIQSATASATSAAQPVAPAAAAATDAAAAPPA